MMSTEDRTALEVAAGRAAVRRAHMEIQWESIPANLKAYEVRLANLLPKDKSICVYAKWALDTWPTAARAKEMGSTPNTLVVLIAVGNHGDEQVVFKELWPEFPSEKLRAQLMLIS